MKWNGRKTGLALLLLAVALLTLLLVLGSAWTEAAQVTDFTRKNLPPSLLYPFGTDWMGRDLFVRTVVGLALSVGIGLVTASVSALVALSLGAASALLGKAADGVVTWIIDLLMGIPHILLLILISFACGKGVYGVMIGIVFTHWMALARVLRGELLQLRQSGYVQVAAKLGLSQWRIFLRHLLPHLLPQFLVGLLLLFPHAVLHEASVTFLGFGLPPEQPAIGIILSESLRYLVTGNWWLAVFPGMALVLVVLLFAGMAGTLRRLLDPASAQK